MSTSRLAEPIVDGRLAKRFVLAAGCMPLLLLAYDAVRGQLGANSVNFAIRTTGLVGLVFLSASLVITPLRRITGWTWLIAARRNLGVLGFAYIFVHFAIFFVLDRAGSLSSTLEEIIERTYLWFGTGALVLMIPLAITSFDGMVTWLGPRRWKRLHRTSYLVVLGGVIHYFLLVKADTTKPLVFTALFAGLMLFRIGDAARTKLTRPARTPRNFWSGELVVADIRPETHDVKTFRFALPDGGPLPFTHTAGQYLNVTLLVDGKKVKRSYTISSPPAARTYVEISVKRAGDGYASHFLHDQVKRGDRVRIAAPAGKFTFPGVGGAHANKRIVLIAGGVGMTPMISVIRALTAAAWDGEMYLVFSNRTRADVIFGDEIAALAAQHPNLHVTLAYSSETGHITRALLAQAIPDFTHGPVMVCGPGPMMTAIRALLEDMGIPPAEIHEEAFLSPKPPAADGEMPAEVDPDATPNVQFARARKSVELPGGLTILECAEACDVEIPFECRSGICGQCKTKLVSGRVVMESQDALTAHDKASGLVLACQAKAIGDIVVDA